MTKAIINALSMALALQRPDVTDLGDCQSFAAGFVAENAELFDQPSRVVHSKQPDAPQRQAPAESRDFIHGTYVPVKGPDGLTDKQRAALQTGVGLCPNCQQPTNDHLPACARASGEVPKAVTKPALPPVQ